MVSEARNEVPLLLVPALMMCAFATTVAEPLAFSCGSTLRFELDGDYGYNFNGRIGHVNLLRTDDPTSNSFNIA